VGYAIQNRLIYFLSQFDNKSICQALYLEDF